MLLAAEAAAADFPRGREHSIALNLLTPAALHHEVLADPHGSF